MRAVVLSSRPDWLQGVITLLFHSACDESPLVTLSARVWPVERQTDYEGKREENLSERRCIILHVVYTSSQPSSVLGKHE